MCDIADAIRALSLLIKKGKLSGWAQQFAEDVISKTQCGKYTGCCSSEMCYHIYRIYNAYHHTEANMKQASIGTMLKQCSGLVGTKDLSEWESNFVTHLMYVTERGNDTRDLSEKQIECILTIFNKKFAS